MKGLIILIAMIYCLSTINCLTKKRRNYMLSERYYDTWEDYIRWFIRNYGSPELGKCNDFRVHEGESDSDWTKPPPFVGEYASCGKPTGRYILRT